MGLFRRGRRVRSSSQSAALNQVGQPQWSGPLAPPPLNSGQYNTGQRTSSQYGNSEYSGGQYNGHQAPPVRDCSARVLAGVWPRELLDPAPEIAQLAQYLHEDLQKIVVRTNADLAELGKQHMSPQERYDTEERFIRVARSMATLRAESTVRQLGGRSLLGNLTPQLTDSRQPRRSPQDIGETTQVVSPEMIREAVAMSRQSSRSAATGVPPVWDPAERTRVLPAYGATSPADSETTQVFARHRVPEESEPVVIDATDSPVVITDAVEPLDTSADLSRHRSAPPVEPSAPPVGPATFAAAEPIVPPLPSYEDVISRHDEPGHLLPHFNIGDTTEPVSSARPASHADLHGGYRPNNQRSSVPAEDTSGRLGSRIAARLTGAGFTEGVPDARGQALRPPPPPPPQPSPPVPARPVSGSDAAIPPRTPTPVGARLALEQPVTLTQLVGALARQQPALTWLVAVRSDGSTVAVTDLLSGWIPAGVEIPRGVGVLAPEVRSGAMSEWAGTVRDSARYLPGRRIQSRALGSAGPEAFAVVEVDAGLGERLLAATAEEMSVPKIAHDLVQDAVSGAGVLPADLDVLRVHLETATQDLIYAYPDVNAEEALSCMLMAAAEALASGQDKVAAYHLAWYAAVRR